VSIDPIALKTDTFKELWKRLRGGRECLFALPHTIFNCGLGFEPPHWALSN